MFYYRTLCRSILNIFMKPRKNFKILLKNYGVNFQLILGKFWANIRVILYYSYCGNYKEISKMFLWNFSEIVKKIWRNVGNTSYKLIFSWKFCDIFLLIFGKTYEKLLEKYEKHFIVSVPWMQLHSVHHDCAKYFPTLNQLIFQFL